MSRIASGKITLARRFVDVNEVVRRSADALGGPDGAGVPELVVDLAEQPLLVDGDPVRLEQVVTNLLDNARKYTPARGRVRVTVAAERGEATIHVVDTGIGISPEVMTRIFEPFAQGASSLQPGPGGLGLGLTLVRGLVERHGGRVSARSAGPELGSEFVVHLPLAAAGRVGGAGLRVGPDRPRPRGASSSSRTTPTGERPCARSSSSSAITSRSPRTGTAASSSPSPLAPRWAWSTSAFPASTATRWRAACAPTPAAATSSSSP